ncbi:MAG: hypothetical protein IJ794_00360 [Lachnospiraceae bacterium]|nr:hypothetical protein [Lachnospiraceae bacterium]
MEQLKAKFEKYCPNCSADDQSLSDYTKWRQSIVDNITTFEELDDFVEKSHNKGKFAGTSKAVL